MKKLIVIILISFMLSGCEVFVVIDTSQPITVDSKVSENRYRCLYSDGNATYFLEIISDESLNIGDPLFLGKNK